jgi:hypothetical protein
MVDDRQHPARAMAAFGSPGALTRVKSTRPMPAADADGGYQGWKRIARGASK